MYLHIGNNKTIRKKDIVAIFDADSATVSAVTRKFLSSAEKKSLVETTIEEIPKSFVLYRDGENYKICFSQLAPAVLVGRIRSGSLI